MSTALCLQKKGWFRPEGSPAAVCRDCGLYFGNYREIAQHSIHAAEVQREQYADIFGGTPEEYGWLGRMDQTAEGPPSL